MGWYRQVLTFVLLVSDRVSVGIEDGVLTATTGSIFTGDKVVVVPATAEDRELTLQQAWWEALGKILAEFSMLQGTPASPPQNLILDLRTPTTANFVAGALWVTRAAPVPMTDMGVWLVANLDFPTIFHLRLANAVEDPNTEGVFNINDWLVPPASAFLVYQAMRRRAMGEIGDQQIIEEFNFIRVRTPMIGVGEAEGPPLEREEPPLEVEEEEPPPGLEEEDIPAATPGGFQASALRSETVFGL